MRTHHETLGALSSAWPFLSPFIGGAVGKVVLVVTDYLKKGGKV